MSPEQSKKAAEGAKALLERKRQERLNKPAAEK
jgi:hypothetical protein